MQRTLPCAVVSRWLAASTALVADAWAAAGWYSWPTYAAGFVVVPVWARFVHRRPGVRELRAALPAAFTGGALGGVTALLVSTADQADLLGW